MPLFRQRHTVEAFQWWPPGSPLHDFENTPVATTPDRRPGKIYAADEKSGHYYVAHDGSPHWLMPGEWIIPKAEQVWTAEAFNLSYEHVPDVPTPKNPEDISRERVAADWGLQQSASDVLKALYDTGGLADSTQPAVKRWLQHHALIAKD
jgi:hypothetical protein